MDKEGEFNRRKRWSRSETSALAKGIGRYGEGRWQEILRDSFLGEQLKRREEEELIAKWDEMMQEEREIGGTTAMETRNKERNVIKEAQAELEKGEEKCRKGSGGLSMLIAAAEEDVCVTKQAREEDESFREDKKEAVKVPKGHHRFMVVPKVGEDGYRGPLTSTVRTTPANDTKTVGHAISAMKWDESKKQGDVSKEKKGSDSGKPSVSHSRLPPAIELPLVDVDPSFKASDKAPVVHASAPMLRHQAVEGESTVRSTLQEDMYSGHNQPVLRHRRHFDQYLNSPPTSSPPGYYGHWYGPPPGGYYQHTDVVPVGALSASFQPSSSALRAPSDQYGPPLRNAYYPPPPPWSMDVQKPSRREFSYVESHASHGLYDREYYCHTMKRQRVGDMTSMPVQMNDDFNYSGSQRYEVPPPIHSAGESHYTYETPHRPEYRPVVYYG